MFFFFCVCDLCVFERKGGRKKGGRDGMEEDGERERERGETGK